MIKKWIHSLIREEINNLANTMNKQVSSFEKEMRGGYADWTKHYQERQNELQEMNKHLHNKMISILEDTSKVTESNNILKEIATAILSLKK